MRLVDLERGCSEGSEICTLITHGLAAFAGTLDRSRVKRFKALDRLQCCVPHINGSELDFCSKQEEIRLDLVLQETRYVYPDGDDSNTILVQETYTFPGCCTCLGVQNDNEL